MLKTIIIEDEHIVLEGLKSMLYEIEPSIEISACISSVEEGIKILSDPPPADIIFSDVQLSDGLSFEIFSFARIQIPVVFITGFNHFIMNAFEYNGIDYLLKPIDKNDLLKAILKYKMLENHFSHQNQTAVNKLSDSFSNKKRSRIVVHKGSENVSLKLEEVVFFYTENKIVYVLDKCGKKYMCDKNLTDMECELEPNSFFRANRQYIININFIKSYRSYERVKLQIDLSVENLKHSIIISQETAPVFRKWINEN
ncbi:MAG TPA: LytTR family DNA-binding domain-containing protein [Flavisolibacter sp.]|nr:LytTR family DNA-binding domain-containing protein [Flavisolibacter sp.]